MIRLPTQPRHFARQIDCTTLIRQHKLPMRLQLRSERRPLCPWARRCVSQVTGQPRRRLFHLWSRQKPDNRRGDSTGDK